MTVVTGIRFSRPSAPVAAMPHDGVVALAEARGFPGSMPAQPWEALDALEDGIAVHDRGCRQVFANTALLRLADTEDGLTRGIGGAVMPTDPLTLRHLQRAMIAAASGTTMDLAVSRPSGSSPFLVRCAAMPGRAGWTVMRVADSAARRAPSAQLLRSTFGLTSAEACLAISLCRGQTLGEIAQERGISIHTVRTQLRALLGKTRTERQADLVGLLSGLAF
jgi:DNA-binding CsgD family transcriptional regulator